MPIGDRLASFHGSGGAAQYIGVTSASNLSAMELVLVGAAVITSFAAALAIQLAVLAAIVHWVASTGQAGR